MWEGRREELEGNDLLHGIPVTREMPDTTGMDKAAVKKLLRVHEKLEKEEVKLKHAVQEVRKAKIEELMSRKNAAEIIGKDWREAVERAEASKSEGVSGGSL